MGLLKRRWIWLCRFRHRRGYGVHSPFAFNFLMDVVYAKGEYYAFHHLKLKFREGNWLEKAYHLKCNRFLFRLANYVHPRQILLYGDFSKGECAYMSEGCHCEFIRSAEQSVNMVAARKDSLVCISQSVMPASWMNIVGQAWNSRSVCIIKGIYRDYEARKQWRRIQMLPQVFVTFDLYEYGIVFYDPSKQKQHYIINF